MADAILLVCHTIHNVAVFKAWIISHFFLDIEHFWETQSLIITDNLKLFYYRGLREWGHINGYLTDTCLTAQDNYKALLDYFKIKY